MELKALPLNIEYNNLNENEPEHQQICIASNGKFNYILGLYDKDTKHFVNERGTVPKDFIYWINMPTNKK